MGQKSIKQNRLRMPEETAAFIRSLHPEIKRRVKAALKAILSNPNRGKSLRNELEGLRSFRVSKGIIDIVAIGPRKYIYEETYRLVKK
jgi:mRNA interferase RelE/StbE